MYVKYLLVILFLTISQVACRWNIGQHNANHVFPQPMPLYRNGETRPLHLSRQKRGLDELRLLREAERGILSSLNYKTEPDLDFKRLFTGENHLKRPPVDDQYKKALFSIGYPTNLPSQFGSVSATDLPDEVKNYIIGEYLSKQLGHSGKSDIGFDFNPIYDKGNFEKRFKDDLELRDRPNVWIDELLKKGPYHKRMVEDTTRNERNELEEELNNLKALETLTNREQPIYMTTESIKDKHQIVIDMRDGSINIKERPTVRQMEKAGRNNDIRIKIKQEGFGENNKGRAPEIKIVIKLPDKKDNVKNDQMESKSEKQTTNEVREEIKNYISLALNLLRKMEEEEENANESNQ